MVIKKNLHHSFESNAVRHNMEWVKINGQHFADDIFKYIFLNQKLIILIESSLTVGSVDKS